MSEVDERPAEGVLDRRQLMPAKQLRELIAHVEHVLTEVQSTGADVAKQAVFVANYFAPWLAGLRSDVDDARFDLNRALHAAVTEPGVPVESEIRRALRVHGVTEDRELDACVVAVRRVLPSMASELADQLADAQLQVSQAGAALAEITKEMHRYGVLASRRHEAAQRLREELAAALLDADRYRGLTPQVCGIGVHTGWFAPSNGVQHGCPWCLIVELSGTGEPEGLADPLPSDEDDDAPTNVLRDLLLLVGVTATEAQVSGWPLEQRRQAEQWAIATHLSASDNPVDVPPRPEFLDAAGEPAGECPAHGPHPHAQLKCLDCPQCTGGAS